MTTQIFTARINKAISEGRISRTAANNVYMREEISCMTDHLIMRVVSYYAELDGKVEALETTRFPASWWDYFKDTHFPRWLLKKFPVKYVERVVYQKVIRVCPHIDMKDMQSNHFQFLAYGYQSDSHQLSPQTCPKV